MRKLMFLFVFLIASTVLFAEAPAKLSDGLEIYLGAGKLMTSSSGNAFLYSQDFETSYHFTGRYFLGPTLSVASTVTRDTGRLGEWAEEHNFVDKKPATTYQYTAVGVAAEWWPTDDLYLFVAPTAFSSPNKDVESKLGVAAGAGVRYTLYKKMVWQTELRFLHVQDFLVPVANAVTWSFSLGWRF